MSTASSRRQFIVRALRLVVFLLMLYFFLAGVELFSGAMKALGRQTAESLFSGLSNPFAGLAVGILATVLVQSSSVTTSTVVAMVGAGSLPLQYAVPMVMGANIGTSITNTLVALGNVTHGPTFRRAFAGATMHDIFNFLSVAVLFPLEILTGFLRRSAYVLETLMPLGWQSGSFKSPIKVAVKWLAAQVERAIELSTGLTGKLLAAVLFMVALMMLITALVMITRQMRLVLADQIEQWLNRVLRRSALLGLAVGAVVTMAVQSSSITTSLLVPLFGAGVLKLEAGFPLVLGANIGTTITALLASTVAGPGGLTIALVHLLFNTCGTILFLPIPALRAIPIRLAELLAEVCTRNRLLVVVYVVGVFFVVPLIGVVLWK